MKKVFLIAAVAIATLTGCQVLNTAASFEITVDNIEFDFPVIVPASAEETTRADGEGMQAFSATTTVTLDDIHSENVQEYADVISKVVISRAVVNVKFTPEGEYAVKDLTISSGGQSITIPSYTAPQDYVLTEAMKTFLSKLVMKLFDEEQVEVTVTGKTDAPASTRLTVKCDSDMVFTVKPLKLGE